MRVAECTNGSSKQILDLRKAKYDIIRKCIIKKWY